MNAVDLSSSLEVTEFDTHLWLEGRHSRAYRKLGAHPITYDGRRGTHFAVWAPSAAEVSVIGEFNGWRAGLHLLENAGPSGIWEGFVPDVGPGTVYKYAITSRVGGYRVDKADPYGFAAEIRPQTASKVWDLGGYTWNDAAWLAVDDRADVDLRSPPRLVAAQRRQPVAHLSRARAATGRLRA